MTIILSVYLLFVFVGVMCAVFGWLHTWRRP